MVGGGGSPGRPCCSGTEDAVVALLDDTPTCSNLFSNSCTKTALVGMGGMPPIERPGGGRAGDAAVSACCCCCLTSSSVPKDPKPKSRLSSSPASHRPMLSTLAGAFALGAVVGTGLLAVAAVVVLVGAVGGGAVEVEGAVVVVVVVVFVVVAAVFQAFVVGGAAGSRPGGVGCSGRGGATTS